MNPDLRRRYVDAQLAHMRTTYRLMPLLAEVALTEVNEMLPGAARLEVMGELNEDWSWTLRIRRVLSSDGSILFDAELGHPDESVENVIDEVDTTYLDDLIHLAGSDFIGRQVIDAGTPATLVQRRRPR